MPERRCRAAVFGVYLEFPGFRYDAWTQNPGNANLPIGNSADKKVGFAGPLIPANPWRSRGYLPHFIGSIAIQHVTFHLADSSPKSVLQKLDIELNRLPPKKRNIERRKRLDTWIEAGYGCCVLREPEIARMAGVPAQFRRRTIFPARMGGDAESCARAGSAERWLGIGQNRSVVEEIYSAEDL